MNASANPQARFQYAVWQNGESKLVDAAVVF